VSGLENWAKEFSSSVLKCLTTFGVKNATTMLEKVCV
jgi:hypothetical protein